MFNLRGHAAVITGSTQGIGRAMAEAFAAAGADVMLHGVAGGAIADEAVAACKRHGVKVDCFISDLTGDPNKTVPELAERAVQSMGRITILGNNAGRLFDVPYEQMTLDRFDRTMRLNVATPYFLTQWFARYWQSHSIAGRVVCTGSINGRLAEADSTAYDISKGALEMLVKTLAMALAPKNIRINGIAPGLIRTRGTDFLEGRPELEAWLRYHTPNGQIPPPDACGPAAVFLCSDEASHIHGHMMLIDGGIGAIQHPPIGDYGQATKP